MVRTSNFLLFIRCISIFLLPILIAGCTIKRDHLLIPVEEIAEGDIVFRRGNSMKTRAVLQADTAGIYSHVGIVVQTDSGMMVVHTTPGERKPGETKDFIKMESIAHFFSPELARNGAIARFLDSSECATPAAKHAIDLYQRRILFDHDYDLNDTTTLYCTELVWHVYLLAGRDITNQRRSMIQNFPMFSDNYIFPSDIFKNQKLIVYYKF